MFIYNIGHTGSGLCCQSLKVWFLWTLIGSPEYWLPIGAKWSIREIQNPVRKVNALGRRCESEGHGFEPCSRKILFYETFAKVQSSSLKRKKKHCIWSLSSFSPTEVNEYRAMTVYSADAKLMLFV